MSNLPSTSAQNPLLDARITLATAVHAQPGVYALLIGSGASTGAGIQTGWGVVKALVTQAAIANGPEVAQDLDPEEWWAAHGDGEPLGYSGVLAAMASTPAARRALLAPFFEPTAEDREQGMKVPSEGHKAIAGLVRRGAVRVIVTTNFDHLIEQALDAEGVTYQVVSTPAAIEGMEPLAHATCSVIKLHGDYARIDQLNTVEELSSYPEPLRDLLERVLDEYGLVINGWSADWDHALVTAIEGTRSRRYPLFWAARSSLGDAATRLANLHRAHVISNASADEFFPDLLGRLEALDGLANPPLSKAMSLARMKRLLPDPTKYIELRDLLDVEVTKLREYIASRPMTTSRSFSGQDAQAEHDDIRQRSDALVELLAHGVYLDRDRQHTDLWIWVITQLMRARKRPNGTYHQEWVDLCHYPALLALRAASLAAIAVERDDVFLRLLREPTWHNYESNDRNQMALDALHDYNVLDHDAILSFPRWTGSRWLEPRSHLLRETLLPTFLPLVGDEESYKELCNRTEYRVALAYHLEPKAQSFSGVPGEFIDRRNWTDSNTLVWETDFRNNAPKDAWGWEPAGDGQPGYFEDQLTALSTTLKAMQRW